MNPLGLPQTIRILVDESIFKHMGKLIEGGVLSADMLLKADNLHKVLPSM